HINKLTPKGLPLALRNAGFEGGAPIYEPASWRHFKASLHMRVGANASKGCFLAGQVYRIANRRLRQPVLALLGFPAMLRMLPHLRQLRLGGAFAMVASRD